MEIIGTDVSETRIITLEKKIRDMEALAKGLINETLDLKSELMTMSKDADDLKMQELRRGTVVRSTISPAQSPIVSQSVSASSDGTTIIRPRAAAPSAPAAPAEPAMVLIMQTDGTMKMEPRAGDSHQTDSSGGYGPDQMPRMTRANKTR
jgi:hypothetical protein